MDELVLMVGGCCEARDVQYNRTDHGYSYYICRNCKEEFREAEDTGHGG